MLLYLKEIINMGTKLLLMQAMALAAIASQSESQIFMEKTSSCNLAGDFSRNITSYHEKPLRKGAFKKKLSKKQRTKLNR